MAKNKHYESKFRQQRIFGSKHNQRLINGIVVRYVYNDEPRKLTWWDDTGFNLNGRRVTIWWTHPRHQFNEAVSDLAYENIPYVTNDEPLFHESDKIFKYVGKSGKRKKANGFKSRSVPERRKWYEELRAEEKRLSTVTDITIVPHYKVDILNWCRGVHICVPLEIHGVSDLHVLCNLVKKLLKGETTLEKEFPGYRYTKDDWARENLNG
jgi:hypothetical protein